jgi:hypothetical protein
VKAVYGLYPDGQTAQQAVNRLRAAGFADRDITILSPQPMEDYEFGQRDKATWMWWIACAGGAVGMATAFGLAWITEVSWPMDVGGLPTFAWWPNLIIVFEMTMLGAIVATVATLVVTARLGRAGGLYDPAVSDGKILVGIEHPPDSAISELQTALGAVRHATVKTI